MFWLQIYRPHYSGERLKALGPLVCLYILLARHNMTSIYDSELTDDEKHLITYKVAKHILITPTCHLWTDEKARDGYGVLRIMHRGQRKRFKAHRLMALCHSWEFIPKHVHVSHICHVRNCVYFEHLSLEEPIINISRQQCVLNGACLDHRGYKQCIL